MEHPPKDSPSPCFFPSLRIKELLKILPGLLLAFSWLISVNLANAQAVWQSQASAGGGGNSASSGTVSKPAGLAVGDLMVMSLAVDTGGTASAVSISAPAWQVINRVDSASGGFLLASYWKIATANDVAASTFSVSFLDAAGAPTFRKWSMGISRITGHNPTTPIVTFSSAVTATSVTAIPAPSLNTTAANQLVLAFFTVKKSATFLPTTGATAPGTERYDVQADPPSHAAYSFVQVAQGATGSRTATASQGEFAAGMQVAIASAPAATPVITASGTIAAVNTTFGTASLTPGSFTVSGANMTAGITITPPSGYEVSTSSGSGYSTSIVVGAPGTIASTTVFIRLAATTAVGTYSGNVTLSSAGADSVTVATTASSVAKATPTGLTPPNASSITFGQTLASSTLSGGSASVPGTFTFTTPSTAPPAGIANQPVTFTPNDTANYNTVSTTASVTVNKANATTTLAAADLTRNYDGSPKSVSATTLPANLTVDITYDGSSIAPTNAGTYTVVATVNDANYSGTASSTLTINQRALTINATAGSKAAGGSEPQLQYQTSGLVTGDPITGSLSRALGETTGIYPISQGSLSAGNNYQTTFTGANFVITGLKAVDDTIQKLATSTRIKIPVADLLANDGVLGADGQVTASTGLTITAVQPGTGNTVSISGAFVLFSSSPEGSDTFTYTLSNGSETSTATVTIDDKESTPFTLRLIRKGTAEFDGTQTLVSHDFIGSPNTTYTVDYSTDLQGWTSTGGHPTGETGSFTVIITKPGDQTSAWNTQMFFRATKP
jgi:hypothetical protein